jgi:hypothetical protein
MRAYGRDRPIFLSADADALSSRVTIAGGKVFRFPIEHELHGSPGLLGKECGDDRVLPGDLFAPESSPHVLFDNTDAVLG